jgi:RNA polymerase sigma-70 factor, ECF subfamily
MAGALPLSWQSVALLDCRSREPPMEPRQPSPTGDLTHLLRTWNAGDQDAFEQLVPLVYDELHRIALRSLAGERSNMSMQATALVNEVCLRLLGWKAVEWQNRGHFFGVSAQMTRRVLVDIARRRRAERRGGTRAVRVSVDDLELAAAEPDAGLVAIDEALEQLGIEDPRKARVVELRFFGGLSMEETARALGISLRTAHNDWAFARAWLYRALTRTDA